ncbi:hypothetical protein HOO68_00025 [Candidatus Gracilibacteria bacterium]|nr:hypothetical protein [Candidatus Gracilibacteria bacterium]
MFSIQIISLQFKSFLISGIYFFLGNVSVNLPIAIIYLGFFYKGGDVDFIGGVLLYILESLLFTGFIMFFDLLIIRFLFKLKLGNKMYFIAGAILAIMIIAIFAILGGL